jgi:hypothetical protein
MPDPEHVGSDTVMERAEVHQAVRRVTAAMSHQLTAARGLDAGPLARQSSEETIAKDRSRNRNAHRAW